MTMRFFRETLLIGCAFRLVHILSFILVIPDGLFEVILSHIILIRYLFDKYFLRVCTVYVGWFLTGTNNEVQHVVVSDHRGGILRQIYHYQSCD